MLTCNIVLITLKILITIFIHNTLIHLIASYSHTLDILFYWNGAMTLGIQNSAHKTDSMMIQGKFECKLHYTVVDREATITMVSEVGFRTLMKYQVYLFLLTRWH